MINFDSEKLKSLQIYFMDFVDSPLQPDNILRQIRNSNAKMLNCSSSCSKFERSKTELSLFKIFYEIYEITAVVL